MKVVDLHPEELIDKLNAGELTISERERLASHLAQCSACRFEIGVRADLEQDAPLFEQRPQLTVAGQSAALRAPVPEVRVPHEAPQAPVSLGARSRRRWRLVLLAAALVLCAGAAAAAVVTGAVHARWLGWSSALDASQSAQQRADAKRSLKWQRSLKAVSAVTVAPPPSAMAQPPESIAAPAVSDAIASPSAPLAQPSNGNARPSVTLKATPVRELVPAAQSAVGMAAAASSVAVFPALTQPPTQGPTLPPQSPAASLFADANRARRAGDADRAVALYHDLQTRFPSSSESQLSRALLAQMLLDRGSPEAALAGFDSYLAEDSPVLAAEALVGRARALEQLGKSAQAIAAWQEVQSRFPGSVHARLAAARLATLGMR
jgi:TolA-binding protein